MTDSVLFLHGRYAGRDLPFYTGLCRGRFKVAVDGGYKFFKASGITPDLLIGDFDSIPRIPRNLPATTKVVKYSSHKDKTDAHLALDYCLKLKAKRIDIVQPSCGEPDQFMGNMMLLTLGQGGTRTRHRSDIRIVNIGYEIRWLSDSSYSITGGKGDLISILPLSSSVTYNCRGTEYSARNVRLRRGETLALRNSITSGKASFRIDGQAFLIRHFSRRR